MPMFQQCNTNVIWFRAKKLSNVMFTLMQSAENQRDRLNSKNFIFIRKNSAKIFCN